MDRMVYSVDNTLPTLRGAWLLYVAPEIAEGSSFLYLAIDGPNVLS